MRCFGMLMSRMVCCLYHCNIGYIRFRAFYGFSVKAKWYLYIYIYTCVCVCMCVLQMALYCISIPNVNGALDFSKVCSDIVPRVKCLIYEARGVNIQIYFLCFRFSHIMISQKCCATSRATPIGVLVSGVFSSLETLGPSTNIIA